MSNYKLLYFNMTGLGEPLRIMLSYCGVPFEDVRLSPEEWAECKSSMPMNQLPVLEIDGKKYNQSKAILRFFAKKYNLYSDDDFEAMEIDSAVDSIDDLTTALSRHYWEQNQSAKEKFKEVASKKLAVALEKFEAQVKKNGGYLVGGKITFADVYYAGVNAYVSNVLGHDINQDHSELKKLVATIMDDSRVRAYLDVRPNTVI